MKFRKKLMSVLMIGVLSTGVLAGCTTDSKKNSGTEKNVTTEDTNKDNKAQAGEINIYSARHYDADKKINEEFEKETGIKVNLVEGKAEELIERLEREGESSEADLFITVDGGVLNTAKEKDLLQDSSSETINAQVPEKFRDSDNNWIGIASRARVIAYSKERVKPEDLSTYEDLTTDKWKGKVLARPSSSLYNQSLLASFIILDGEEKAKAWADGIVKNFAREPNGNDRDQANAIVAGEGDVAIMNTYYIGLLANSDDAEEAKVGEAVGVFFPNQDSTGAHLNISGVGVTKHSKNKENAIKYIEYLTGEKAQTEISNINYEFPVNGKAKMPELLKSWGEFKAQELDYSKLGEYNKRATEILNEVGWK